MSDLTRMRELEAENARLKRMYADLALESHQGRVDRKNLAPSAKWQVVEVMVIEHRLSVARACGAAGLSRAAFYKVPLLLQEKDAGGIDTLNGVAERDDRWGFWRCHDLLRLDGRP